MKYFITGIFLFIITFLVIIAACYGLGYVVGLLLSFLGVKELFGIPIAKFMGVVVVVSCVIFRSI